MTMNRNAGAAIAATVVVAAVVILGFLEMGSPATQRLRQADRRRVLALERIAQQVNNAWRRDTKTLPKDLEKVNGRDQNDPVSGKAFAYHAKSGSAYELCATFATDDREATPSGSARDSWVHPRGDYCFELDASQVIPPAPYY
jgi:hypothetical protein